MAQRATRRAVFVAALCVWALIACGGVSFARADTGMLNGHAFSGPFADYWQAHGGLDALGYPITDPTYESDPTDGQRYLTQWFERVRMEIQGQNSDGTPRVVLGKLGRELRREAVAVDPDFQDAPALDDPPALNDTNYTYFADTHHNLRGRFLDYWQHNGGQNAFGSPISEEHLEFDAETGTAYVMQWFERARMEYHPENGAPHDIELGLLGNAIKAQPHQFDLQWKIGQRASFLNDPNTVFADSAGNIWVNDRGNRRINKYGKNHTLLDFWYMPGGTQAIAGVVGDHPNNGPVLYQVSLYPINNVNSVQELMGDGTWHSLPLADTGDPDSLTPNQSIAVDPSGNIYILKYADQSNTLVWAYDPKGAFLGKYIERRSVTQPTALAVSADTLYIADGAGRSFLTYPIAQSGGAAKDVTRVALPRNADTTQSGSALAIAVTPQGDTVFVGEPGRVTAFDKTSSVVNTYGTPGSGAGQIFDPHGLAVDSAGTLYVADPDNHQISLFDSATTYLGNIQEPFTTPGLLGSATAVATLPGKVPQIAVSDPAANRIQTFFTTGQYSQKRWAATHISALAADGEGHLFGLSRSDSMVYAFDQDGKVVAKWGGIGSDKAQFLLPGALAVGVDDAVYVADTGNQRIQKFDAKGTFVALWGAKGTAAGQFGGPYISDLFSGPTSLTLDPATGTLYVVDPANARIEMFDQKGTFLAAITGLETGRPFAPVAVAAAPAPIGTAPDGSSPTPTDTVAPTTDEGVYVLCADALYRLDSRGAVTARVRASTVLSGVNPGGTGDGNVNDLRAIAVDGTGGLFAADGLGRVQKLQILP